MIWLSPAQLKDLGVSKGILHRNRDRWTWRKTSERGRNGRQIEEVLLESMQTEWQKKWLAARPVEPIGSLTTELTSSPAPLRDVDDDALGVADMAVDAEDRLTQALVRYTPNVRDSLLNEAQRLASIVDRYEVISPKRIKNAAGKHEFVPEVLALCDEARCTDPVILAIEPARGKPKSPHTLDAWLKEYRQLGLAAFLRKPPEASGAIDKRKAEISAEAIEWLNANWRKKPSPLKLHQALVREANKKGWTIPSYGWVYRKYESLPKIVSTLTFQGEKAYTGKYAPFVPRTVEDLAALQVLVGDHSVRDVSVMLPTGEITRPWLTLWQDLRTGLIWGWHLDLTPSSNTIGLAYVNGAKTFGAQPISNPAAGFFSYLYTDQGKDYRSKTLTGETLTFKNAARIEGGLEQLCTQRKVGFMNEMGIKHIMARGYNAREKSIERTHKDISEWEKNTFENEYCGKGTEHKPERWTASWHRHQKLRKKVGANLSWLMSESPFMTLEDYRENLAGWINEYNHSEHTRSVLGGATIVPVQEYERLYTTHYEISDDALALLLMKAARRKIGKDGIQMFQSHWYFLAEEMAAFKGQEVEVRFSEGDYSRIWVVLPNHEVVEASLITPSSILQPNKKTMEAVSRQRAHEKKLNRDYLLVEQSNWRGETTEDRVAQLINPEPDPEPEVQKIAVNAGPSVTNLTRFDRPKLAGSGRSHVTAEQVDGANVIDMFSKTTPSDEWLKEEWDD